MAYVVVCIVALLASGLTLFTGFGLGTLLLPAFALVFPVEIAVSATAVVHLANNLFKLALVGRHADGRLVARFGIPALGGAVIGAWCLTLLAGLPALFSYRLGGRELTVTGVKLVIAGLILVFAVIELRGSRAEGEDGRPAHLALGGLLAGFFGGLSGHQGALRSAFLIRAADSKKVFIATGVACAVLVDLARLAVYGRSFLLSNLAASWDSGVGGLVLAATGSAFAGAFLGVRLIGKVTYATLRWVVGLLLIGLALALGAGVI